MNQQNSEDEQNRCIDEKMSKIKHKLSIMSGKECVRKTSDAVNLSYELALSGQREGLLT
ncbi:MAG TPA: hypothetical protein PLT76_10315 [Candidatus Omnitrophota bacterium]|nr:hypothetical protein [Candidatus Omnitrophota bacterium]HQO59093.1 hypothetical protein [Candidatus Omnitrophota bacterium]